MTKKQKILFYFSTFAILFLFFLIIFGDNGVIDLNHVKKERDNLTEENQFIQREITLLSTEINRLKNDPAYIEAIARQELGMIGNDEIILRFKEDRKDKEETSPAGMEND